MSRLAFSTICIVLLCGYSLRYQNYNETEIIWSSDYSLRLEDFSDRVCGETSGHIAESYVGLSFRAELPNRFNGNVTIDATFSRDKSWMCSDHASGALLMHEQGHFDITEVIKRECLDSMSKLEVDASEFLTATDSIFKHFYTKLWDMQDIYDIETDYHRNRLEQHKWNSKLDSILAYNTDNNSVFIPIKRP